MVEVRERDATVRRGGWPLRTLDRLFGWWLLVMTVLVLFRLVMAWV